MNRKEKIILYACLILSIVLSLYSLYRTFPKTYLPTYKLTGANTAVFQKKLQSSIIDIKQEGSDVRLLFDGRFGRWEDIDDKKTDFKQWKNEFTLKIGDSFQAEPLKQFGIEFKLVRIEDQGLVIEYKSTSQMPEIGRRITDQGTVRLPWIINKENKANNTGAGNLAPLVARP